MKRTIFLFLFYFLVIPLCFGQDFSMMNRYRTAKVRLTIIDGDDGAPVEYATVYLCPQGDTTITYFTFSGSDGVAVIDDVTQGKYELHAELVGFSPLIKNIDVKLSEWDNEKNLGTLTMDQNTEFLDAATVSAVGNPVIIKKDTVVYNANAYKTVENGMLVDLLKKMPGIQIGADGSVKVNGEDVNRITVGGKTFFQKDPGLAVKTLPAKIVDQIQVIDKAKDDAEFSRVGTKEDQEKVMDIQLKDEYQKGWFGNMKMSGGLSLNGEKQPEGADIVLFNGNAMVSHYSPSDQTILLVSGKNANEPGSWSMDDGFGFGVPGSENDEMSVKQGLQTTGQGGINYNTTRLKGMETSASLSYNYLKKNVHEVSSRTSFQGDLPNVFSDGYFGGIGTDQNISFSGELKNTDKSKYMLTFRPYFMYVAQDRNTSRTSRTKTGDQLDNESSSSVTSHNNDISVFAELETGIRDIGKERRSLTLNGEFFYDNLSGKSDEYSKTIYKTYEDIRDLNYDDRNANSGAELELSYVEPFGERWSMQARAAGSYNGNSTSKEARNGFDGSINETYSSTSDNHDMNIRERLLLQYNKDDTSILFGFQIDEEQNVTIANHFGKESIVGRGEWIINWAPYVDFVMKKNVTTLRFEYKGKSSTPSGKRIMPILDISDPVHISMGNIYLRPQFTHNAMLNFRSSSPEKYSFLDVFMNGSLSTTPIVTASWFDVDGVRYSIPVNSRKPGRNVSLYASYNQPFGKKKNFTFSLDGDVNYSANTGYQTSQRLPSIDKDNFDYEVFMKLFWGDASGNRFYSGESGFSESNTNTLSASLFPTLAYKLEMFSATLMGFATNNITKYSLDKSADMNTWDFNVTGEILFNTKNDWQFNTDIGYTFYKGYTEGYGEPELIWNAGIAKDIKAFTISFKVADILGQQKSLHRTTSAEFVEDVRRNVMGRFFLLGIVFNFGRMNAAQSNKVEQAMWEMAY